MSVALRQWSIGRAVQPVIAATIVCFVLASGSIQAWIPVARWLRWGALLVLVALALAWAWQRRPMRLVPPAFVLAAAFLGLALISVAWSADPRETIGRAGAFGLVLLAAGGLAWAVAGRPADAERVLDAVVAAAGLVALGGLLVLLFRYDRAVQPATVSSPARYQGLGGGPNTATMLLAVALPAAAHTALDARETARRVAGWLIAVGLLASIAASGSRGALAAAVAGSLTWAALRAKTLRRAAVSVLVMAGSALAVLGASTLPEPAPLGTQSPPVAADPNPPPVAAVPPYFDANALLRLQDDVGHPPPGIGIVTPGRDPTGSSGRTEAWRGALLQAGDRPLLGYGFGTEENVFVDRFVGFNSGVPENSYVGLVLELGIAGLLVFIAFALALLLPVIRRPSANDLAAACAGVLVAGLTLGLFQSYLYAAGNNATAALWIGALLLVGLVRDNDAERV